jgi:hypothetical protein
VLESLGYVVILISCLGWMDFGQGKEYTWWNLIVFIANY